MELTRRTVFIAISVLTFLFSFPVIASNANQHMTEAIEHAETAQIHGKAGHTSTLLEYAQKSLTHAKAAEKEYAEAHQHISEAIKHLEEAITHAKQNHAEKATQQMVEALKHMRHSAAE
ncbi:small metal-binding protein SmbP [Nitrosomonas sp.]|uniref:small metal-binding protein SmbP n=1 Tax=Nitrosomonas sp. TaxID=42353 RepID=UPI001D5E4A4E|nr:small metal-binding protein SmbP [Nitrosomonas sp.]MBX3618090.1 metal-binding protein SmbP [Nitrosomonas sp.]